MNFEVGSAASYREFVISPLGAHSRRLEEAIPQEAISYLNYPFYPIVEGRNDYTGWAVIGQSKHSLKLGGELGIPLTLLFQNLAALGWEVPESNPILSYLQMGNVICLFLRKHFTLREMIILYPASSMDIIYPLSRGYWLSHLFNSYRNLEF